MAAQDIAQRLSLRMGESVAVPITGVESAMTIDEQTAQVSTSSAGITVVGRSPGDTIVQVFTAQAMRVFVVHVDPPTPRPPGPPPLANINDHGAITTFWGDNRYQVSAGRSTIQGTRFDHALTFHGRAGKGEYQASAQFMTGDTPNTLQYASVAWASDAKDLSGEVGDTHGRLYGSSLVGAAPLRGMRASLTRKFAQDRGEWTGETFAGELRGAADPYAYHLSQPAAGTAFAGGYTPAAMPALRLSFASSVLAFSTGRVSVAQVGNTGVLAGGVVRAVHKNGLGMELRTALSAAAEHRDGAAFAAVPSFGVAAVYQDTHGTQRLDYEDNRPGMVIPQFGGAMPGTRRLSGSLDRRSRGFSGSLSASYSQIETLTGQSGGGLSYRIGTAMPLGQQTSLSLSGGQLSVTLPVIASNRGPYLRDWSRLYGTSRVDHAPKSGRWALYSELTLSRSKSSDGGSLGAEGTVSVQRRRAPEGRWEASGALMAVANQVEVRESVLAVDQPPLNLSMSASGQARFVQGPFESFGGLGLQVIASPTQQVSPTINLGFRFTPTAAHQIAASYGGARWLYGGAWNHSLSATYVYHFGDAVRAVPIFEFMSYGVVEGRICYDEDSDGSCAPDEPPIPGMPLVLSNGARATSAADGSYRFERVKPGFYHLDVDEDLMREKGRPTTVLAAAFDLPVRGNQRASFAVARACRIRGHLVEDLDLDGQVEEGEPLVGGPLVVANGAGGTFQARVNKIGTFAFTLPCGDYGLEIDPASLPTMRSPGDEEEIRVTTTTNETPVAKLLVRSIRTIAGSVFIDRNGNGTRDADEPIVAGATARFGAATGQTDETGAFLLRRLPAGAGELTVEPASLPAGLVPGAPVSKSLPQDPAAIEDVHLPVLPAQ